MEELLTQFEQFAQTHIHLAPFAIFGLLLLAGLNIPVSEDAMLFLSAILATQHMVGSRRSQILRPDFLTQVQNSTIGFQNIQT